MLKAFIFDFDGVIVHSEPLHFQQLQRVLAEEGIPLSRQEYDAVHLGKTDRDCFITALESAGRPWTEPLIEALIARKAAYYGEQRSQLQLLPGVDAFVRRAAARFLTAIGSGALREDIDWVLARSGLGSAFRVVVSAEDYAQGKPDPACFRTALARLNAGLEAPVHPGECVVVEDGRHGIEAARAAGMRCLAVASSHAPQELDAADMVVETLEGLDPEEVAARLA